MKPEDFKNSKSGKCIKTRQGYWAFIPNPLPHKITYDNTMIHMLSEADRSLGELSGTGRLLPNPYILIKLYIRREAVSSCQIEGTQASLNDLFIYEASHLQEVKKSDVQEVKNYVNAMEYGINRLQDLPISTRLIREVHKVLMKDVRGGHATPGKLRKSQNWIGPPGCLLNDATFVPPPVDEMQNALKEWELFLHSNSTLPPLIQCALMHYQFEAIHPFLDGNGRIGRLLITFFLFEKGFLTQPLLYLSEFFNKYRDEYYSKLLLVSRTSDLKGWVEFFLRGVSVQAQNAVSNAKKILELYEEHRQSVKSSKKVPYSAHRIVDEIFINPVISISRLSKKWNLPFNSVKTGVLRLVKLGILHDDTNKKRNKVFIAKKLLEILTPSEISSI